MSDLDEQKRRVGIELAKLASSGQVIGVGTGSTVDAALMALADRMSTEKLNLAVVPTSYQSAWTCEQMGMRVLDPGYSGQIDWGFDGADQIDSRGRLIKGGGGALLQEKILAAKCREYIVIVDDSKCVENLGQGYDVPIEVIPEAAHYVLSKLPTIGAKNPRLRQAQGKKGPVITERGNLLIDASFIPIADNLDKELNSIVGVVENGLFFNFTTRALIAGSSGVQQRNFSR